MKLIDITDKYGLETCKYPLEPYLVPETYRGQPKYKFDLCIGCAACSVACPPNAIRVMAVDTKIVWEFDCGRCIFCARCDEVCPTGAIRLSTEYELAAKFDKSALIQRGEMDMASCKECGKLYSTKRLINYTLRKLELSNLNEERIKHARFYVNLCPECKSKNAILSLKNDRKEIL